MAVGYCIFGYEEKDELALWNTPGMPNLGRLKLSLSLSLMKGYDKRVDMCEYGLALPDDEHAFLRPDRSLTGA